MQTLLPLERFEHGIKHMVNLKLIEIENEDSPNRDITSTADPAKLYRDHLTLPEEITDAKQKNELCSQIYAYFKASSE